MPITFFIVIKSEEKGTFILNTINGNEVLSGKFSEGNSKINISDLPGGIYLLNIKNAGRAFTKKLIIQ